MGSNNKIDIRESKFLVKEKEVINSLLKCRQLRTLILDSQFNETRKLRFGCNLFQSNSITFFRLVYSRLIQMKFLPKPFYYNSECKCLKIEDPCLLISITNRYVPFIMNV